MNSRPNDELARTLVMKIDEKKKGADFHQAPITGLVEETIPVRKTKST